MKQIATEDFSTVFGQSRCALWHTKSIKPRQFGNIVKIRLENEKKFPILPMLNHAEQIIIDSLKPYRRNANCMSTYMFSYTGNTMEDEFCRSAGSKMA